MKQAVSVFTASLAGPPEVLARGWQTLSAAERARAGAFAAERDRARFVAARAVLRGILAGILGDPPESLMFSQTPIGKPCLMAGDIPRFLRFNLAHSGDLMAVAIAWDREVGIDVEHRHEFGPGDLDAMIGLFFPQQSKRLSALPHARRLSEFHRLWVRQEALLKARGSGFAPAPQARWNMAVRDIDVGPGLFAAVAVEGGVNRVRITQYQERAAA